jgi:hypothetical protein
VPLVDSLTLRWFVRDLDIRSSLIAHAMQEPLEEMTRTGNQSRMLQFFRAVCERSWNPELGSFVATMEGDTLDASLLRLNEVGFL